MSTAAIIGGIAFALFVSVGRQTLSILLLVILITGSVVMGSRTLVFFLERKRRFISRHALWYADQATDHRYRKLYHRAFIRRLEDEVSSLSESEPPDSAFIQSVVKGIQRTLHHVGVPNPRVLILRNGGERHYVSYCAGPDDGIISDGGFIARGATISSILDITTLNAVYSSECFVGLESQLFTVMANCDQLCDLDRSLLEQATHLLSQACA